MASLYIIAIGGTGAKCAEAIIHAVAAGLFTPKPLKDSKIKILFVDPDDANGNVTRAKKTLEIYQKCYDLFKNSTVDDEQWQLPWMSMSIEDKDIWSPFGAGNKTLGDFFNYPNYKDTPIGHLFDVLYTQAERIDNLDEGFHGHPAVGSAVMSQINFGQDPDLFWKAFIDEVIQDYDRGTPKIFLCGSIFGGTGASGFPTLGKLIRNQLDLSRDPDKPKLGGLLMLPYFTYPVPPHQDQTEIYADPKDFLLKSEAALQYYLGQSEETFNIIYLLGDNELVDMGKFKKGKADQLNKPHFLELYAALAARHFWLSDEIQTERGKVALMESDQPGVISWKDIPKQEKNSLGNDIDAKDALIAMTRFAFGWTAGCAVDLQVAAAVGIEKVKAGMPWVADFFHTKRLFGEDKLPELDKKEKDKIQIIDNWCESFLSWLALIHYSQSSAARIKLFQANKFADPDGQIRKDITVFPDLVIDADRLNRSQYRELTYGFKPLKNQIGSPNTGALGLAKAWYLLSKPQ
jgi:hypothetical protein